MDPHSILHFNSSIIMGISFKISLPFPYSNISLCPDTFLLTCSSILKLQSGVREDERYLKCDMVLSLQQIVNARQH